MKVSANWIHHFYHNNYTDLINYSPWHAVIFFYECLRHQNTLQKLNRKTSLCSGVIFFHVSLILSSLSVIWYFPPIWRETSKVYFISFQWEEQVEWRHKLILVYSVFASWQCDSAYYPYCLSMSGWKTNILTLVFPLDTSYRYVCRNISILEDSSTAMSASTRLQEERVRKQVTQVSNQRPSSLTSRG